MNPTTWNFNPLLPTSNIINYDSATEPYNNPNQPYDGVPGVASTIVSGGGKLKMFLGLGFPLPAPGTKATGHAIYSQILWKNPTAYQSSLIAGATQQYYGGPSEVPLYAGPTSWYANATPDNEAGQYDPESNAYANVRAYDIATLAYDTSTDNYDGMTVTNGFGNITYSDSAYSYSSNISYSNIVKIPESFSNWRNATAWTPIVGGNSF